MTTTENNNNIHSEHVQIGDYQLLFHHWPCDHETNAVALIFHGFLAHGLYPTVKYAAEVLQPQMRVISYDMQGHGRSEGLSGYLPSAEQVLHEATAVAQYVQTTYGTDPPPTKLFLVGSSMGGAIALGVSSQIATTISGVILLAPMLQLSVLSFEQTLLQGLAALVPTLSCIPSSSTSAAVQYRDPIKRHECEQDPLVVKSRTIRVGSANTCVQLTNLIVPTTAPLLMLLADEDVVVQNQGAERWYERCDSDDKTLKRYPALHGLLCEPRPLLDQIQQDLVEWIQARL